MAKVNHFDNLLWLWANDKEAEFKLFCKRKDLDATNVYSLQFFRNENLRPVVNS